ncbi:response regulator transcription factor [Propioniferax innocua]|uniref:LuxR family two component transcriptional regulator n=1 Tax=Propioniferax innocua TaxID=1753 RepID=A0A542ZCD1_9ACTN|nr:response regulator transcription factor [Propioniferax innocua]TQL58006.1 LuxR family two component transcriptional regulator [Propioniferax innocua]
MTAACDRPIRVLLADDQPLLLASLRTILDAQAEIDVVEAVEDGDAALAALDRRLVDVAVLDIRMPGTDGITAARRIADRASPPKVVMLTTFDSEDLVRAALDAGAQGFLLKDADPAELATAIRLVHEGRSVLASGVTGHVIRAYREAVAHSAGRISSRARQGLAMLTPRELDVLLALSDGASNGEIATVLGVGEATVKTHMSNLLIKLDCRDRVALVVLAHRAGLA